MTIRDRLVPAARSTVKAASAAADVVLRPATGITILIYHRVGAGSGGQMDLSPAVFDEQLAWLKTNRRVISLDDAVQQLRTGTVDSGAVASDTVGSDAVADRGAGATGTVTDGVVITFDDGTTDWVDHVLPALDRHGVPATFYVATDFVDRQVPFPGNGRPIDWSGLKELASSSLVTIGSHTHRHLLLDRLPEVEIDDELDRSIDLLGEHLGKQPAHFAYPKAVAGSPAAETAVRKRFVTAVLAGTRPNPPGSDLHRLSRSPIQASDTGGWFRRKASGGMHLEDDLRRLANRVRYRGATQ